MSTQQAKKNAKKQLLLILFATSVGKGREGGIFDQKIDLDRGNLSRRNIRAAWGGGGCHTSCFPLFPPPPCSADHERDWSPCKIKVVFFGLATNTLDARNNNKQEVLYLQPMIPGLATLPG